MSGVIKATTVRGSDIFPSPVYCRTVLEEIFRNAKVYFLEPLLANEFAHTLMPAPQKIIPEESAAICLRGLERFDVEQIRREPYNPDVEDLYFSIETRLIDLRGADHAGRIRTARSRDDVDMTMYRMVLRSRSLTVLRSLLALREVMVRLAWLPPGLFDPRVDPSTARATYDPGPLPDGLWNGWSAMPAAFRLPIGT